MAPNDDSTPLRQSGSSAAATLGAAFAAAALAGGLAGVVLTVVWFGWQPLLLSFCALMIVANACAVAYLTLRRPGLYLAASSLSAVLILWGVLATYLGLIVLGLTEPLWIPGVVLLLNGLVNRHTVKRTRSRPG